MSRRSMLVLLTVMSAGALTLPSGICRADTPAQVSQLRAGDYGTLEKEFARLLASREKDDSGKSRLLTLYQTVSTKPGDFGSTADWIALLARWAKNSPNSHFAQASLGMAVADAASQARGGSFAATRSSPTRPSSST